MEKGRRGGANLPTDTQHEAGDADGKTGYDSPASGCQDFSQKKKKVPQSKYNSHEHSSYIPVFSFLLREGGVLTKINFIPSTLCEEQNFCLSS